MFTLLALLVYLMGLAGSFQSPTPATEVFLADFSVRDARVTIGAPINISNSPGYDNQPSFTPDGSAVFFTSVRGNRKPDPGNSAQAGSDIYRYDIRSRQLFQVTRTAESEYSPTVTPDGRHISVVRVEADGTQRLWRFSIDGHAPELVLSDVQPVGYHAWADAQTLALFVLGKPPTLQVADTRTGKADIVAQGIGRSVQRIPGGGISFVLREAAAEGQGPVLTIAELEPGTRQATPLVRVVPGASEADTAWTPDGLLLMSHQGKLFGWRRGESDMKPVADLESLGLRGVTRLAISPKGDRIALVALPPQ